MRKIMGMSRWCIARLAILLLAVCSGFGIEPGKTNVDFYLGLFLGFVISIFIIGWLLLGPKREKDLWELPDWDRPFLPMNRYPVAFWHLSALAMFTSGLCGALIHIQGDSNAFNLGMFSFAMGFVLLIAIEGFCRLRKW